MEQRTEEWYAARLGVITGSKAHNLLSGEATRKTLIIQLLRENAMASAKQIPETPDMERGTELEPAAIKAYTELTGHEVRGADDYIVSPKNSRWAFSPDGLIGDDGGLETKCRQPEHHLRRMLFGIKPEEKHQCEWGLFVTGREWWDYEGYCPDLPKKMQTFIHRLTITDKRRDEIDTIATKFLITLDEYREEYGLIF